MWLQWFQSQAQEIAQEYLARLPASGEDSNLYAGLRTVAPYVPPPTTPGEDNTDWLAINKEFS